MIDALTLLEHGLSTKARLCCKKLTGAFDPEMGNSHLSPL